MRPEMKSQPTTKEILFTLLFIVGEVKMKFRFRGWSEENSPFSKSSIHISIFHCVIPSSYYYVASPKY